MPGIFDEDLPRVNAPSSNETTEGEGAGWGTAAALGGGAALLALLARKPGAAREALKYANATRQQLMLTGLAVPKSMLGNVGATVARSLEEKSLNPLRELFSGETVRDAAKAFGSARTVGPVGKANTNLPFPLDLPGRTMGAMDTATQSALQRSGMTAKESEAALFQTPLGENYGKFGETLDSPAARYILPFRRTPFNQFSEGMKTLKSDYPHKAVTAGYGIAGAAHGAATADDQFPVSIPLATAFSAKYGVPYALGALAGRVYSGGKNSAGIAGSILPVSEYGVEQSVTDPTAPFFDPSFTRVMSKF